MQGDVLKSRPHPLQWNKVRRKKIDGKAILLRGVKNLLRGVQEIQSHVNMERPGFPNRGASSNFTSTEGLRLRMVLGLFSAQFLLCPKCFSLPAQIKEWRS